jgi:hypothetical protein
MAHPNLTPERGPDVWTRQARTAHARDRVERAIVAGSGLLLLVLGLRRRTPARHAMAAAGAGLLALAGTPRGVRRVREWNDGRRWHRSRRDMVTDQSAESFPASDAPTWTGSASAGATD